MNEFVEDDDDVDKFIAIDEPIENPTSKKERAMVDRSSGNETAAEEVAAAVARADDEDDNSEAEGATTGITSASVCVEADPS